MDMPKTSPFESTSIEALGQKVYMSLMQEDILDTWEIETTLRQKMGKGMEDFTVILVDRFIQWAPSIQNTKDIIPSTLGVIFTQAMETFLPMPVADEDLRMAKTAILLQVPEFVSALLLPFKQLQSLRIKSVMFAQDSIVEFYLSQSEEQAQKLYSKYPKMLIRAANHVARSMEKNHIAEQGYTTNY